MRRGRPERTTCRNSCTLHVQTCPTGTGGPGSSPARNRPICKRRQSEVDLPIQLSGDTCAPKSPPQTMPSLIGFIFCPNVAVAAACWQVNGPASLTYAPLSTCTELHLSGKFLSLSLGQSEVRSSRRPAKFRCSKRVTWREQNAPLSIAVCLRQLQRYSIFQPH